MASKKKHLTVHEGGNNPRKRTQAERPLLMAVVPSSALTTKTLRASDYLGVDRSKPRKKPGDGRSRSAPELNVLNWAKYWHRDMIRLARKEGYTDMKKFFKESHEVGPADKRLFDAVSNFIEYENNLTRGG